jgi:hypothetical protein
METIKINVSQKIAAEWKTFPKEMQDKISSIFQNQIDAYSRKRKIGNLFKLMDKISDEAQKNGLTEEILQEILNEQE